MRPWILLPLLAACTAGDGGTDEDDGPTDVGGHDTYTPGMERAGTEGLYKVRLVEADPGPPDRGDNLWTLQIVDTSDAPQDAVSVVVSPYMPDHGHGTTPLDYDGVATGAPGTFTAGPFDLFMPGYWAITVHVDGGGGNEDAAIFEFDIEG